MQRNRSKKVLVFLFGCVGREIRVGSTEELLSSAESFQPLPPRAARLVYRIVFNPHAIYTNTTELERYSRQSALGFRICSRVGVGKVKNRRQRSSLLDFE
jgi:hypothetical protein